VHAPIPDAGGKARAQSLKLATQTRVNYLVHVPLFAGLTKRQVRAVAGASHTVRRPAGATVVTEGSDTHDLFIIVDGSVDVLRNGRRVARLGPGEFFGEVALFDPGPRTATVMTTSEVVALELSRRGLLETVATDPQISLRMMETLARRLREATEKVTY
jgi:CRP/FNR family transcriptional regulator, cyclic AMP receptor protein